MSIACYSILLASQGKAETLEEKGAPIQEIKVEGNKRVEDSAILRIFSSLHREKLNARELTEKLDALWKLGFFSDIEASSEEVNGKLILWITVKEKPAITDIEFEGLKEFSDEDIRKQLETKLYTIVNDGTITSDIRNIEKKYVEKGYYLSKVTFRLDEKNQDEATLIFHVEENEQVLVGNIHFIGNKFFTDVDLMERLGSQPYTRLAAFGSSSLYKTEMISRDTEILSFLYQDQGFAEVKVSKPVVFLDRDKKFVDITYTIEEGPQYKVEGIKVSNDVGPHLYLEEDLIKIMKLKNGDLFRYSYFAKDVEQLIEKYGDLGYAFVDVNPKTSFNKELKTVSLDYEIDKGNQIYFGQILIKGNSKTRDNVIRRELEVFDGELYSGTKLAKSKQNISRLGFFEDVKFLKERDEKQSALMNLKLGIKEKSTGHFQAALGFIPKGETNEKWYGQGTYEEKNQFGRAWEASFTARYTNLKDYQLELGFLDPRVNDSEWSLGFNGLYGQQTKRFAIGVDVLQAEKTISASVGRKLFEQFYGSFSLSKSILSSEEDVPALKGFELNGTKNMLSLAILRRDLDNYIDPTEGNYTTLKHKFIGGVLGGDFHYSESIATINHYIPVDFTENYRSYFKLTGVMGQLWAFGRDKVPESERYRLGGSLSLRGYEYWDVGPYLRRGRSPISEGFDYNQGGDKEAYVQLEYFFPLIPKAGIKGVVFFDAGNVFLEDELISLSQFEFDVGFGFRWVTPVAPFRFEWASPYNKKTHKFGDMVFQFSLGI